MQVNFEQIYPFLLERTVRQMKKISQQRITDAGFDLTVEQWVILYAISQEEGSAQIAISEGTFKDAPTVTRIIDMLVKKSFVYRKLDDADRRKFNLYLTDEGRTTVQTLIPVIEGIRADGWKGLERSDFQELKRMLDRMYKNFGG